MKKELRAARKDLVYKQNLVMDSHIENTVSNILEMISIKHCGVLADISAARQNRASNGLIPVEEESYRDKTRRIDEAIDQIRRAISSLRKI